MRVRVRVLVAHIPCKYTSTVIGVSQLDNCDFIDLRSLCVETKIGLWRITAAPAVTTLIDHLPTLIGRRGYTHSDLSKGDWTPQQIINPQVISHNRLVIGWGLKRSVCVSLVRDSPNNHHGYCIWYWWNLQYVTYHDSVQRTTINWIQPRNG